MTGQHPTTELLQMFALLAGAVVVTVAVIWGILKIVGEFISKWKKNE